MDIHLKAHIKALTENIELINIAFIVALFADCAWITRDLIISGPTYLLIVIASLLWFSLALVAWAFIRYHYKQYYTILNKDVVNTTLEEESHAERMRSYYTDYSRWSKGE